MIKPLDDRVVVKPAKKLTETSKGILIPDDAQEKSIEGIVMAVGPGRILESNNTACMRLKEGDRVLYSKFVGVEVIYQDEDYLVIKESEILAVLEG